MIFLPFIATAAQFSPIAPPVPQQTAACGKPVYAADKLVCSDAELLALDRWLANKLTRAPLAVRGTVWIEDQERWFRRSRMCAFRIDQRRCLIAAYLERQAILSALTSPPIVRGECRLADKRKAELTEDNGAGALIIAGHIVAIGTSVGGSWQPFISYARAGRRADFRIWNGARIAICRTVAPDVTRQ